MKTILDRIVEVYPEVNLIVADGFNDAIIGIDEVEMRLIYSVHKCLNILKIQTEAEEAMEFFLNVIQDADAGIKTPIFCWDIY